MGRLGLWLRWSWRDLRRRWPLVVAIAVVIAIGTGLYTGLGSLENWRKASNDASFALLRAHHLEIVLAEGVAPAGSLQRLVGSLAGDVARVDERLIFPAQVEVARPGAEPLLTPGQVVGAPLGPRGPAIDGLYAEVGRGLRAEDAARPVAVLETGFGAYHGLPAAGSLRLAGGVLEYVGHASSPEQFLVTRPGGGDFGGAEANFATIFTSLETAQRLAGRRRVVNGAVLRLREGADAAITRDRLERALTERGLAAEVTTLAEEPAHRVLYQDAEGDQQLFNIFAVLILAGAAFAAFNLASRIVEAQRREIGIGMALGVPPAELAIRPLLLGVQIALAGMAFGLLLGAFMGEIFRGVLEELLPLPVMRTPFEAEVFIRGALLGLALPIVATAVPVWRGLRLTPVEAIRVGFRSAKSSGVAGLAKRLHLPGSVIAQLPLRNVLRAPRRTLMTMLGIGAVVTVLVAFLGFVDSFLATVDRSESEVAGTTPERVTVSLDGFHARDSSLVRAVDEAQGVLRAETRLEVAAGLSAASTADPSFAATVTLLDPREAEVWQPTVSSGSAPAPGHGEILIAEEAARDLGLAVGDEIALAHPRRVGPGAFAEAESTLRVSGLHPNPFRSFAYMDSSEAGLFGLEGLANQIAVAPAPGATEEEIERALFDLPGVASVERATATTDFVRERLDDFVGVLRLTEGFALVLALLIAFNSSSISADERARENATMLAFGVPAREVVGLAVAESLLTGVAGTLIGIGGGLLVIGWVVNETLPETLPDLGLAISVAPGSLAIAALVGVLAVALAPLLTARRIRRMDVPSTLRVVE